MVKFFDFYSNAVKISRIAIKIVKKYRKRGVTIVLINHFEIFIEIIYCFKNLTIFKGVTHFIKVSTFPPFSVISILGGKHFKKRVIPQHPMLFGAVTAIPNSRDATVAL